MNKKEILESVANATVPDGATLVEREHGFGIRVARLGKNPGGLSIAMARIFLARLTEDTADLGETPDAELFQRLHSSSSTYHQEATEALTIPKLGKSVVENHKKVVQRLREISVKLGISYEEPDDPLLHD